MARRFRIKLLGIGLGLVGLFSLSVSANAPATEGQIVTQPFIEQVLDKASTIDAMRTAFTLQANGEISALESHIRQLPPLTREATLYRLLSSPLRLDNDKWREYLATLSQQQPHFLLRHQQDGYWVTTPAFHYAAAARKQLNRYRQQQLTQELGMLLSYRQLVMTEWIDPDQSDYRQRRDALVTMIADYDADGLAYLADQYLNDPTLMWMPDNAILAALAQATERSALYERLWRRGTDQYSLAALHALRERGTDPFALRQMMAAADNPSLRGPAIRQLANLSPLPAPVADFLLTQLSLRQGKEVAQLLVEAGKGDWLSGLQDQLGPLGQQHIASALPSR
ncbi:hypothetical protein BZG25_14120 [Salinivibrio sp. ML198]|uniref:hypothetical protein n=1 Tax=unclassified Salinivibrio TaxID=2636825 RepID=UPI000984E0FF|nr:MULTISPECIES: hypothetical protein [unclassified Salinivibrio]OOE68048.1 hypothetical protein BZG20_03675 [Salinivibrio sp. IB868]OOE74849.1 hypothetical protein BZG22_07585 [Salinivibrio sp. IB870]OOE78056.1 hypothetical protein BZG25_14120 [Salinivibrio sp. ML198]